MRRVLIVEDSVSTRAFVRAVLEASDFAEGHGGCQVVEASSGFDAMRLLPRGPYDLIVTDINMTDINGLELIRFIRERERQAMRARPGQRRGDGDVLRGAVGLHRDVAGGQHGRQIARVQHRRRLVRGADPGGADDVVGRPVGDRQIRPRGQGGAAQGRRAAENVPQNLGHDRAPASRPEHRRRAPGESAGAETSR